MGVVTVGVRILNGFVFDSDTDGFHASAPMLGD
jgi:hypothetical protein